MATNPYAPPEATVADVGFGAATTQPVKIFSSQGRMGRLRYLCYLGVGYFLLAFAVGGMVALGAAAGPSTGVGLIGMGIFGIAYVWLAILWGIQRSHDMGWSGWTVLGALIPFVGFLWIFMPGTPGNNAYGAPPPPNGTGVVLGALLFPLVVVIGIVAAVALPAYQDYVKRAGTAQVR